MTAANHRETPHNVDPIFLNRWSPRAYSGEPMNAEHLMTILDAAHWAPSASNHQPWRFVYGIKGTPSFDRLLSLLVPGNQRWAKDAGALLFILSKTHTGEPGDAERRTIGTHSFDAGSAWMSLALQAQMLGYHAHGMAGIDFGKVPEALNLPEDVKIEAAIAVGKMGKLEDLPEDLQPREKPSGRKPLESVAFDGQFPG